MIKDQCFCPYVNKCGQDIQGICYGEYERCTIYYKSKNIDRNKPSTGLERFKLKYPLYEQMFIGSKK